MNWEQKEKLFEGSERILFSSIIIIFLLDPVPFFLSGKQRDFYHLPGLLFRYRNVSKRLELGWNTGAEKDIHREKQREWEN